MEFVDLYPIHRSHIPHCSLHPTQSNHGLKSTSRLEVHLYLSRSWSVALRVFVLFVLASTTELGNVAHGQVQPGSTNKCERLLDVMNLRTHAIELVTPEYPDTAIRSRKTGLVVAEICVPAGASTPDVRIVAAPNSDIANSVRKALGKSRFRTMWDSSFRAYGGKVIFYFVSQDNGWKVLEPKEQFFVGPDFAIAQQN